MASAEEHFRIAENMLNIFEGKDTNVEQIKAVSAAAQVHATLALAAYIRDSEARFIMSETP